METISNIASTATSTVSNLIYGTPDTATKTNETAGKEPVSGQTGKGTVDEPYDQGNSEPALDKNTSSTTSTGIESSKVTEPTGSIQEPEDLIKAYNSEAGDATNSTTGISSTATGITDKAGVTDQVRKPTDVNADASTSSTGKDTLWRGVDAYKDSSSTGPDPGTGVKPLESTTASTSSAVTGPDPGTGVKPLEPTNTSTSSTVTGTEPTSLTSGASTTGGPKGDIDPEPKNYSIGDLTSGKETPPKPVGDNATSTTTPSHTDSKSNLVGERAGHGGPTSAVYPSNQGVASEKKSSISPSGDDDEKSGKMDKLKDKLKNKLHIGSKDH